jgi:hypothetical protein
VSGPSANAPLRSAGARLRMPACAGVAMGACFALVACIPPADEVDLPCPPEGTTLTYEDFGAPLLARHCNGCHAADSMKRRGAPSDVTFDTVDEVRALAGFVFDRSVDADSMPPGPEGPTLAERDALGEWLACGAPTRADLPPESP